MELREGTDEDEDVEDCVDDAIELMPTLEENLSAPLTKDILNKKVTDQEEDFHGSNNSQSKHHDKSILAEDGVPKPTVQNSVHHSEAFTKPGLIIDGAAMSE